MAGKPFLIPRLNHPKTENPWMRFLTHQILTPLIGFIEDDGHVAQPLSDPGRSALRPRGKPLPHAAFIHLDFLDEETIHVYALGVFRIGYSRAQRLSDDPCR